MWYGIWRDKPPIYSADKISILAFINANIQWYRIFIWIRGILVILMNIPTLIMPSSPYILRDDAHNLRQRQLTLRKLRSKAPTTFRCIADEVMVSIAKLGLKRRWRAGHRHKLISRDTQVIRLAFKPYRRWFLDRRAHSLLVPRCIIRYFIVRAVASDYTRHYRAGEVVSACSRFTSI